MFTECVSGVRDQVINVANGGNHASMGFDTRRDGNRGSYSSQANNFRHFSSLDEERQSNSALIHLTDREMLDKVLEEGIRLKKKNKQLRMEMIERENKDIELKRVLEIKLQDAYNKTESIVSELKAQHFIEISEVANRRNEEIEALHSHITLMKEDISSLESIREEVTRQESLIKSLQQELALANQEKEAAWENGRNSGINTSKESYQSEMIQLCNDLDSIQKELDQSKDQIKSLEQANTSLRHENESKYCSECNRWSYEAQKLHKGWEESEQKCSKLKEDILYHQDKNERLERQILVLKQEQEQERQKIAMDMRHVLKSEKETRLLSELQLAKDQIIELQMSLEEIMKAQSKVLSEAKVVQQENELLRNELSFFTSSSKRHKEKPMISSPQFPGAGGESLEGASFAVSGIARRASDNHSISNTIGKASPVTSSYNRGNYPSTSS